MQVLLEYQAIFQKQMNMLLLALAKGESHALFSFMAVAFAYGFFHAAGPGHGKAVISSYLLANGETLKKGLWLSFFSSLMQAFSTFILVGGFYYFFNMSAKLMLQSLSLLETATAFMLILMGSLLLYRRFSHHRACVHLPPAEQLRVKRHWREDMLLILSVGIRPCTGAVILLSFALTKGLWLYGAAAVLLVAFGTFIAVSVLAALAVYVKKYAIIFAQQGNVKAYNAMMILELCAALMLIALGALLLFGFITQEASGLMRRF